MTNAKETKFVLWFEEINIKDIGLVGGKNASLGEMYQKLTKEGVRVPYGFAVTASAFRYFLKSAGLDEKIKQILKGLNTSDMKNLSERGQEVRQVILEATFPDELKNEILGAYKKLADIEKQKNVDVAVRSSATAEDLPDSSFAGQQESYLNISGGSSLLEACKKCMASLFTDRAISYRYDKHYDHLAVALSVTVQKMVRSDLASSGVMFTIHTETGFREAVVINGSYGLGEYIVKGQVTPDEFLVFKPTLQKKFQPIIGRSLGSKKQKLVYATGGTTPTQNREVPQAESEVFCLNDDEILYLARAAVKIENHYQRPMDIEWAKDGKNSLLYIVQARPETVEAKKDPNVIEEYILEEKGKVIVTGAAVGKKIGSGLARVIPNVAQIANFKQGEVLITQMTDPDWEPIMKKASAIVTESGGRTCHAAIISRELGIPCIVGTGFATTTVKTGQKVTVDCSAGEVGVLYDGALKFKKVSTDVQDLARPKTRIMMNVGDPEAAFTESFIPNDGVGLAREEFIISNYIKIHPQALLHFDSLTDEVVKKQITDLTRGYANKRQYYIDKLAEGIARIAAAFYPKDVIVRLSDFKTNEYANLVGGKDFEPVEDNPMIGWRGASRYYDPKYKDAFILECEALKKVRNIMGLTNVKIMIPFCRTVEEGKQVIQIMADNGLKRGKDGLEVYVMCEIPANVILGEEFCKIFDGFSIGSNDLTQLTLGVDRDSALVSHVYDENNLAVKTLVKQIIKIAHAHKPRRKVGICGQAPSDFPEFVKFLVQEGVDSMSLIPDTVIKTTQKVLLTEKSLKK